VVLVVFTTAAELGIQSKVDRNGYAADVLELSAGGASIQAPAFVLPGLNPTSLVMVQGYGHGVGAVAKGVGVDVGPLLSNGQGVATGVKVTRTGKSVVLCSTQDHFSVPGNPFKEMTFAQMTQQAAGAAERKLGLGERPHFRTASAGDYEKDPAFAQAKDISGNFGLVELKVPGKPTALKQPDAPIKYDGQQWGMVVDLSSCIGCNICAIACQAENNIPSVGREQVLLGRELHWIRVDRYFTGDVDTPSAVHQPVRASTARTPPASRCAPCPPRCTTRRGSTPWRTTGALARGTAPTTAPSRSGASTTWTSPRRVTTTSPKRTRPGWPPSSCSATRTSRCVTAA